MADPKHPRHYDEAFKRQIVQLYESGKPSRETGAEYDIARSTPRRRVQGIRDSGSARAADNRTPEQNRILELERENRRLRMEVDVLRRAAPAYARKSGPWRPTGGRCPISAQRWHRGLLTCVKISDTESRGSHAARGSSPGRGAVLSKNSSITCAGIR